MTEPLPPYLVHRDGQLHFDTRRFLEYYGYAVTPANERVAAEVFVEVSREKWPDVQVIETMAPIPGGR